MSERPHDTPRDDDDEDAREWEAGSFLAGAVLGALIGAGAALLLAPRSGAATRRRLRRRARALADDARGGFESARDQLLEKKEALRDRLARGIDRVERELEG
ncbi:MAG TPA: YtxH domain-containing protein [Gemmatimonadales bacterium]|nr:YtxH domain-containing protein [Gemmatimonadales bacterium]